MKYFMPRILYFDTNTDNHVIDLAIITIIYSPIFFMHKQVYFIYLAAKLKTDQIDVSQKISNFITISCSKSNRRAVGRCINYSAETKIRIRTWRGGSG